MAEIFRNLVIFVEGGWGEKANVPGFSWTIHHPKGSVSFLCYFNQSEEQDVGLGWFRYKVNCIPKSILI